MVGNKVSTPDSYKTYLALSNSPVSKTVYLDIVNQFFKFMMSLIFQGEQIKLPFKTGTVLIQGAKIKPKLEVINGVNVIKGVGPDWVKTKKLWDSSPEAKAAKKIVYHLNEHTNGIRYKITWTKKGINIENHSLYSLIFSRANKRAVHQMILDGKEYFVKN